MRKPPIGVMKPDWPHPLADRIIVSAGPPHAAVEERSRVVHGVAAVHVEDRTLTVAWGRLVILGPDPASPTPSPGSWMMDLETISYGKLATQAYAVEITLKDGRTLVGKATLGSTNGRIFHFESEGEWKGLEEAQAAPDESATQVSLVSIPG